MIRRYRETDAVQLAPLHNRVSPQMKLSAQRFHEYITASLANGGFAWIITEPQISGYAAVSAVPGLPGVGDLSGFIAPDLQRQGLGSKLLEVLLKDLQESEYWQIAHHVTDLNSPVAQFLMDHHFFLEHEEWQLVLKDLSRLPDTPIEQSLRLQTFPKPTAVSLFCRLYKESFTGLPWDQPFTPSEVSVTLNDARNMLFLQHNDEIVGFAWVDLDSKKVGLIEPLGILPTHQNKGYGRFLLISALKELLHRGAQQVEIGAWNNNQPAIKLYQSLGFRRFKTFTYLAYNLTDPDI